MLLKTITTTTTNTSTTLTHPLLTITSLFHHHKPTTFPITTKPFTHSLRTTTVKPMSWLTRLGFGTRTPTDPSSDQSSSIAQGPDDDIPAPGQQFAQFGAGCFWGVELAFQRLPGVTKTEVGYTQGFMHNPSYNDVCSGTTNHNEVVRVQYDPKECSFESLLDCFWDRHDPTTLNRQDFLPVLDTIYLIVGIDKNPGVHEF
ncbi:peptide methionine sulfoxide reductase [Artemisia annua]|uniref:peptide-methionine (S)-S-oxide reductase n=1 Tax=Artemisia annua TaxID=35608 RepID=A0A2U1P8G8_ARTAN|nr:peptide methionine sulfoxide reductase [Artemisia annua]